MATNPMQRRARNSFLIGALVATLILGIIIGLLIFIMMNLRKENQNLQAKEIYVLKDNIQSGGEITADKLTKVLVSSSAAPSNAIKPENLDEKNIAKINLTKGTTLTSDMFYIDETTVGQNSRKQEYNVITLPMDLQTGDFIDIRLLLPTGQDFIVVSKKKVEIPQIAGVDSVDTVSLEMTEDEILTMSNAIIEAFKIEGSKIYATQYTDAGNQEALTPTYRVNAEVAELMNNEAEFKNILEVAWNGLLARLNNAKAKDIRTKYIDAAINQQTDADENEKAKMQESITKSQTTREEYLQSLNGTPTD